MECANCEVSGLSFKRCKGCYRVYYCSKKCQTDDWLEHRLICSKQAESIEDRNQTLEKDLAVKVNAGDDTRDKMIDESFRSESSLCISVEENRISNLAFEETRMNNDQLLENSTSSDAMMKQMQKEPKGWKEVTNEADIAKNEFSHSTGETVQLNERDVPDDSTKYEVQGSRQIGEEVKHNCCTKCGVPGCVKKCSRCKDAFYCSVQCQQQDWKQHKRTCKKDENDRDSKVEFYLDHRGDNPFPFFSYSQVKPGGYICLQDPVTHIFGDRSVGIRIDDPSEVRVLDIEKVMEFEAS